ncbi:MAG: hypothetical protein QOI73_1498, partial [Solirubrobacteraceae bacterium]|nr:hypothetical protein [Solirubrobacteraceae bacterium]
MAMKVKQRRLMAPILVGALTTVVALFGGAAAASAAVTVSAGPDIPDPNRPGNNPVSVGEQNLPSSLTLRNTSTGNQLTETVTLTNITVVPSCGVVASVNCPLASFDPDVFALSATGTGAAGTACANQTFSITNIDAAQDKYQFVPISPASAPILGPASGTTAAATCIINFTASVLKVPTLDSRPDLPGAQTNELGGVTATASGGQVGTGTGSNLVTVLRGTLPILTQVNPASVLIGGSFSDNATLVPAPGAVAPTGNVTFVVYGPGDSNCLGPVAFTSTNPLNAAGTSAQSNQFTPTAVGTYNVVATYNGDANYNPVTGVCGEATEIVVVTATPPPPPPPPPVAPPPP